MIKKKKINIYCPYRIRGDMMFDQTGIPPTTCLVFSSGSVSCVPSVKHVAKCATDFSLWPYDTHRCRINFGSWVHSGEEVNIFLDKKGVN